MCLFAPRCAFVCVRLRVCVCVCVFVFGRVGAVRRRTRGLKWDCCVCACACVCVRVCLRVCLCLCLYLWLVADFDGVGLLVADDLGRSFLPH